MSSITAIVQLDAEEPHEVVLTNLNGLKLGEILAKAKTTALTELNLDGTELAIAFAPMIRSYAATLILLNLRCVFVVQCE